MFDDMIRDLERLRDKWASRPPHPEEANLPDGMDVGPPRPAGGADSSGTVRIAIDADGVPESIAVDQGWRREVGTERLAEAVHEASENAAKAQLAARFQTLVPISERIAELSPAVRHDYSAGPMWRLGERIRDLDDIDAFRPEVTGTGAAALGKVEIRLAGDGLRSFTADPAWLARHDDDEVADALARALRSARVELLTARRTHPSR